MKHIENRSRSPLLKSLACDRKALLLFFVIVFALPAQAASPWEDAVDELMRAMTGPIARGLSLVAIVIAGLLWAFGEESKRSLAGVLFGGAMAVSAISFYTWLFQ